MKSHYKFLVLIYAAATWGCTSQAPSSPDTFLGEMTSTGPNPSGTPSPVTSNQIIGSWLSTCAANATAGRSGTNLVSFSASQMTQTISNYPNLYCSGGADFVTQMIGNYFLGGQSPTVSKATTLTGSILQIIMRATTQASVTNANSQSYCGYTDWSVNVTKSVALNNPCLNGMATSFHEIVAISGSRLYFGNDSGTALDNTAPYTRQ